MKRMLVAFLYGSLGIVCATAMPCGHSAGKEIVVTKHVRGTRSPG